MVTSTPPVTPPATAAVPAAVAQMEKSKTMTRVQEKADQKSKMRDSLVEAEKQPDHVSEDKAERSSIEEDGSLLSDQWSLLVNNQTQQELSSTEVKEELNWFPTAVYNFPFFLYGLNYFKIIIILYHKQLFKCYLFC